MPGSPRRPSGLTLIESLIAAGLLSMVLLATYATLVLSLRYQQKHEDQVATFQYAFNAVSRMETALAAAAAGSLLYEPDNSGFVFVSAQPPGTGPFEFEGSTGRPRWRKFVAFYLENEGGDQVLLCKERPFAPTGSLPPTPPLASLKDDLTLPRVTVARNVAQLLVTADGAADLTLKIKSLREKDYNSLTVRARVAFRQ